jgi:formylglycine-generating enzyme
MKTIILNYFLVIWLLSKIPPTTDSVSDNIDGMVFLTGGKYISTIVLDTIEVRIQPFFIDKYEVSIQEFERFVKATGYVTNAEIKNASSLIIKGGKIVESQGVNWRHDERGILRNKAEYDYPVVHVSRDDAQAYAKWSGKRIPTMYEWEYAAKSSPTNQVDEPKMNQSAWYSQNSGSKIHPRGLKDPNGKGIYDLLGNVSEHVNVPKATQLPPGLSLEIVSGTMGGCFFWESNLISESIIAYGTNTGRAFYTGFRCVKDLPK